MHGLILFCTLCSKTLYEIWSVILQRALINTCTASCRHIEGVSMVTRHEEAAVPEEERARVCGSGHVVSQDGDFSVGMWGVNQSYIKHTALVTAAGQDLQLIPDHLSSHRTCSFQCSGFSRCCWTRWESKFSSATACNIAYAGFLHWAIHRNPPPSEYKSYNQSHYLWNNCGCEDIRRFVCVV